MLRLLSRLGAVSLMTVPLVVYRGHFEGLGRSFGWRQHTYEARTLAERIARDAGGPPVPGRLPADLDAFAAFTADNPAQVARAAEVRGAIAAGDLARVAALADEAIAEENRLIPIRAEESRRKLAETRRLADWVLGLGILAETFGALADFLARGRRPPPPEAPGEPAPTPEDLRVLDERNAELAIRINDLRSELSLYEARNGRDLSHAKVSKAIERLIDRLPGGSDDGERGR